jgi:hypothetical protein
MTDLQFTPEQLLDQARGNALALTLATVAFFKAQGLGLEELVEFMGTQLARGWETMRGQGAISTMEFLALNMVSYGAKLESLVGDEFRATAIISNWPARQWLSYFGLNTKDVDAWSDLFKPIIVSLDLNYERSNEGEKLIYTISLK